MNIFLLLLSVYCKKKYEGKVYRFEIDTKSQQQLLSNLVDQYHLDLWTENTIGMVDVRVPKSLDNEIKSKAIGIKSRIYIDDVQKRVDEEAKYSIDNMLKFKDDFTLSEERIFSDYQDTLVYQSFLETLPDSEKIYLGKTFLGAEINGVKFGTGDKNIVFHGGIHAREWIGPATVVYIANAISKGTDPNRNFPFAWSKPGASGDPCSDAFYGPSPGSSKEVQAITNYIRSLSNVVSYIDFHAYSQLFMFPFGHDCNYKNKDEKDLMNASNAAVKAIKSVNGLRFKNGELGVKYSFAVELRPTGFLGGGFLLPAKYIVPAGKETLAGAAERLQKQTNKLPDEITNEKQFMRIKEAGEYLNEKEMLCGVRPRNQHGYYDPQTEHITNSGYLCITPFKLTSGKQILVNRGWISRDDLDKNRAIKGEIEIEGCLRQGESNSSMRLKNEPQNNLWYSVDLESMAKETDSEPILVELTAGEFSLSLVSAYMLARRKKFKLF
ncbi:Carboxypeptidase A4 [Terramyces sp. JEL0728]|nr:Carboxypeptidase A4 [Terramyces sp. JEL0728]